MQRVGWGPLPHPSIYYIAVYSYWYYIHHTKYQAANTAPSKRRMNDTWEERSHEIAKKRKKEKNEKALLPPGNNGEAKRRSDTGVPLPLHPIPAEMPEGIGRELERQEGLGQLAIECIGRAIAEQTSCSPTLDYCRSGSAVLSKGSLPANI